MNKCMRIATASVFLLLLAATAGAQDTSSLDRAMAQLESDGYFEKCRAGEMRGCSYFVRLVVLHVNPQGDINGWGTLTKGGGSNVEGYADDAIVFGANPSNLHNVFDLVASAGAVGARLQIAGPHPRRTGDTWEAAKQLSAAQLAYLKPGGGTSNPPPPPPPPPPPVSLQPVLEAIAALRAEVNALQAKLDALSAILPAVDASRIASESARDAAQDAASRIDKAHADVLIAIDLGRQQLATEYVGSTRAFGGSLTLSPRR
jgi:hypothetical protein